MTLASSVEPSGGLAGQIPAELAHRPAAWRRMTQVRSGELLHHSGGRSMMNRARQVWSRTEQQLRQQSAELRQRVADLEQVEAESRRARKALQESEDKYRTLVERSLQGLVVIQDFRIVFANTAFAEISGYAVEELLSLSPEQVRAMIHPDDQALVWGRFRGRLEGEPVPPRYEYRAVRKDGAVRWLEMFSSATEYNGEAAAQATCVDITERKRTEEALRASEAQYRSLFEGIPVGLYRTTPEGRILDANPALMQMLGCPDRESLLALNVADLYADSENREREQALLEQEGMVRGFEVQLRRQCQSEELIWVRDTCRAVQDADGRVLCYEGSLEDITQRKRSEAEIRRLFEAEQERRQLAETLRRVSMVLSSTLQLDEVLALILEQLGQVLPFDSASVQRLRDDHLEIVACQGFQEPDRVVGLVFPLNPSFPNYRVATTKEPLALEDVTQEYPHFKAESDAYVSDRTRSWLGVPLMVRDECMGMIAIDRAGVRPYSDGEVQLAMTFASQAAMAMYNARLFEELKARRVYLEGVLGSVPDAVVTLDARHQIVEWNPGAEKLFGYSAEEVLGQDLDDLITNPDTLEEAVGLAQVVLSGGDVHPLEATRYRKDGGRIRDVSNVPVIMLTARGQEVDRVKGLKIGADDYVIKPFSLKELEARIQAVLRRAAWPPPTKSPITYGDDYLTVNLAERRVVVQGEPLELTPTEYRLLAYLVQNAGLVLTNRQLLERVWGWEYVGDVDYVRVYIWRLRKKIERNPGAPKYIRTEHGVGYRFEKAN